jgi:enterochelin esterase-like enzyme
MNRIFILMLFFLVACVAEPPAGSETPTREEEAGEIGVTTPAPTATTQKDRPGRAEIADAPTASPVPPDTTATPPPLPTTVPPTETPVPCRISGRVLSDTFPSNIAFGDYDYRIYLPPCYGRDQRVYPTLYLFGGNTHDEAYWDEAGLDELAEEAIMAGEMPPLLIVMPDGGWVANNSSGGPGSYEGLVMDELLPFIEENYCAWPDPAGRAIGGLSRGGYWSLEIAFRHPEQFARVGGHSAALIDSFAGPEVNPQFTALNNDLGDLDIYLDIGEDDWLLPNTLRLHEDMAAADIPHEWHLNPGAHEDSYWPAHFADYLEWYTAGWPTERESYPRCVREAE